MRRKRSRLYKRLEKTSRKNLLFNLLGIVFITLLVVKFGIPMIISFTLFVSGVRNSETNIASGDNVSYIPPPILNPLPTATNSAEIVVSGTASSDQTISLYVNNVKTDQTKTKQNGTFSFDITLEERENTIKVKVISGKGQESDFSESLKISYKSSLPTLNIEHPADGRSFSGEEKIVEVRGQTDPLVKVTVNGFRAVIDQYNNFSYNLPLKEGENVVRIIAYDEALNKTEKSITITYFP